MSLRSRLMPYILLTLAAVGVFAIAAWVAMNAIEPVPPPPVPPSKGEVRFDPRVDVRNHPLFNTLKTPVRGKVTLGILGRMNPFLGASGGLEALQEGGEQLGGIAEVPLGGASVVAFSRGTTQGITVLLRTGSSAYEVRRFNSEAESSSVGTWTIDAADLNITPIAIQEDRTGTVWLLSAGGRIGSLQANGKPLWGSVALEGVQSPITAAQAWFTLDGAGRLWLTDGASVFVGNGLAFERVDVAAQLSITNKQAMGLPMEGAVPDEVRAPRRLQMLADGRVAILMTRFMVAFPLNLQGGAEVIVAPGTVITAEPDGSLWSVVRDASGAVSRWVRTVRNGAREFTDLVVLPKQTADAPNRTAASETALYALDYVPGATVLWSVRQESWVASVLAPQGAQPRDQVERVLVDREGNLWALLAQRGLLLIRPSS